MDILDCYCRHPSGFGLFLRSPLQSCYFTFDLRNKTITIITTTPVISIGGKIGKERGREKTEGEWRVRRRLNGLPLCSDYRVYGSVTKRDSQRWSVHFVVDQSFAYLSKNPKERHHSMGESAWPSNSINRLGSAGQAVRLPWWRPMDDTVGSSVR